MCDQLGFTDGKYSFANLHMLLPTYLLKGISHATPGVSMSKLVLQTHGNNLLFFLNETLVGGEEPVIEPV